VTERRSGGHGGGAGCDRQESGVVICDAFQTSLQDGQNKFHYFLVRRSGDEKLTLFQQYVAPPLH